MSKIHFKRLAQALVAFHRSEGFMLTDEQYESLVDQIALACNEFNDHFDYARFREACGVQL